MDTWYIQQEFNEWFANVRSNRRLTAIMPMLQELSSDDNDNEPEGSARQESRQTQSPAQGASRDPGPSTPPEKEADGNKDKDTQDPGSGSPSSDAIMKKLGASRFYLHPHTVIIKGQDNFIYGSFDKKFPFLFLKFKTNPINPLAYVTHVTHSDFGAVGMVDPRIEDINSIITLATRGIFSNKDKEELEKEEDKTDDSLTPSLFKNILGRFVTHVSYKSLTGVRKRPIRTPILQLSYNKDGWVGPQTHTLKSRCGTFFPRTHALRWRQFLGTPPVMSKRQAIASASSLKEVLVHKNFPKKLLKFHGLI